ncbi:hypothetical protein TRIUR3_06771 [Triticum urartu]|uniref:F-box domain-containing protein n=1 Tax=Triticum urartu TaxID=4572 RepID=M7Z5V7_TRIUA|nr:hypothetical protein TRIUR3_06771 [Triticum urartu]
MQRPSKLPAASLLGTPTFSGPQGWADLPDGLLHSIVDRLGSFRDLLGFAATCPSWQAAYLAYPSKSIFCTKFPPLLIQPHVRAQGPLLPCTGGCHELVTCKVIPSLPDPSRNARDEVDRLFLCSSLLDLPVGSDSWFEVQLPHMFEIGEIVEFKCQFILSDGHASFYTVQLVPRLALHEMTTKFHDTIKLVREEGEEVFGRLVVCGDMLLMGDGARSFYRLDMSTKPATWMTVENLNNWALFTGGGPTLSCKSPELWGGRSNVGYSASSSQPWSLYGVCGAPDPVQDTLPINVDVDRMVPTWPCWLYPSMFYSDGR